MSLLLGVCAALGSLCAGLLGVAAWLWLTRIRTSIPGPPTLPLLGNALRFVKVPVLWDRLGELHRRYGDIFRFYVGPKLVIVLTQPEDVQRILLTSDQRQRDPYIVHILRTLFGEGLLATKGQVWKKQRKLVEAALHKQELQKFMEKFNEGGSFLCDQLAECEGREVDVYCKLMHAAVRSTTDTIFDVKLEEIYPDPQERAEFAVLIADAARAFSKIVFRPWTTISFISWMTADGRLISSFKTIINYVMDVGFDLARKKLSSINANDRTVLTLLLPEKDSEQIFTKKEMYDQVISVVAAGSDSSTSTMGYLLTMLGLSPEWQERARRELDDCFGTGDDYLRPVTMADLGHLPVVDAIVKETLRLFPTVPVMPYLLPEDTPLAGARHVAPRGSSALICLFLMHRHPQLFPEPLKFDPGRFLEGGSAVSRSTYSYIPFSIGPHQCVAARFAVLQAKAALVAVLRRYRILPGSSREELEASVISLVTHLVTGFRITCVPREDISSKSSSRRMVV